MKIVIPTHRRMPRQSTLNNLPASWIDRTVLVVDREDYELRKLYPLRDVELLVVPDEVKTIAAKRAWIISNIDAESILMLDDDLRFAVRTGQGTKLRQATQQDMEDHLELMMEQLDNCVHAGWSPRQGNNNVKDSGWQRNCRMVFSLGYNLHALRELVATGVVELGRIETREDMDLTLQLLRAGYRNEVSFDIACDQVGGFAAPGGCSAPGQRTLVASDLDAHKLAALHPGLVKVVTKAYEGSPTRQEVIVQWKKAFKHV